MLALGPMLTSAAEHTVSSAVILRGKRSCYSLFVVLENEEGDFLFIGLINFFTHDLCPTAFGWQWKFI